MKITVLGSCRQNSIYEHFNVTQIQEQVSYPHYTKETLEVIRFCKFGHLTPEETLFTFRTPLLSKKPLHFTNKLKKEFESTDVFIVEIASKITYQYGNIFVHHVASEQKKKGSIRNQISQKIQSKTEIENDLIAIKRELNRPLIVVSHLVTYQRGERHLLSEWLEEICLRHKIYFINPIKELAKKGIEIGHYLFKRERVLMHLSPEGHLLMGRIYKEFIHKIENQTKITRLGFKDLFRMKKGGVAPSV